MTAWFNDLRIYDQYGFAFLAVAGTALAIWLIYKVTHRASWWPAIDRWQGITGPFINVISVLFGLTLAFLANDTWSTRDQALTTVYREADALHSLAALSHTLPLPLHQQTCEAINQYAQGSAQEWRHLKRRDADRGVRQQADHLLEVVASAAVSQAVATPVQTLMLQEVKTIRAQRDHRISLSQTHINPLKWLSMAFLGLMSLIAIAAVHLDKPRAALLAMTIFGLASAPVAAIILIQSNPFWQPAAIKPDPIAAVRCEPTTM